MIQSYETGAVFKLVDEFSPKLAQISEKLAAFDEKISALQRKFKAFGEIKLGNLKAGLDGIESKFGAIGTKADGTANKIAASFQRIDGPVTEVGRKILGLEGRFGGLSDKASAALDSVGGKFGSLGTQSTAAIDTVAGNFTRADEAIRTTGAAVDGLSEKLRLAGVATKELGRPPGSGGGGKPPGGANPGDRHGGRKHPTEAGIDSAITGYIGAEAVGHGAADILKHGMEMAHVQEQMLQGGMKQEEVAEATRASWEQAAKQGLSVITIMEDIKELRFPFGSTEHAIQFIEPLEKMRVVLNSVEPGRGSHSVDSVYEMARAGELKGLNDVKDYISYFDNMTKAISATGGKVGPREFMQATQYGKLASFGWDEEFYTKYLPTLIQTMKPSTAGQSLMSLTNTLVGGAVTKRSLGQMQDLGLIGDSSKITYDNFGQPKGMKPGAIVGTDEFVKDPLLWAKDYLRPLLEKKFGSLDVDTNKEAAIQNMTGLFGNRNSAAAVAELALRTKSFDRDAGLITEARGIGGADDLLKHDPTAVMNNFKNSWDNLLISLGNSSAQKAIDMLNGMADAINKASAFANLHPDLTSNFVGAMGGIAVGLGVLAAVGFAVFLPGGLAAVGLTTLAGALGGMVAVNWAKVRDFPSDLDKDWNTSLAMWARNFHTHVDDIGKDWNSLISNVASFGTRIGDAIGGWIGAIEAKLQAIPGIGRFFEKKEWSPANAQAGGRQHWTPSGSNPGAVPSVPSVPVPPDPTGGIMGLMSYSDPGVRDLENIIYRGTLHAFTDFANGGRNGDGAGAGGAGGSGGFTNASYETGGAGDYAAPHGRPVSLPSIRYGRPHSGRDGAPLIDGPVGRFAGGKTFDTKAPEVMHRLMGDFGLDKLAAAKVLGNLGHESQGFTAFHEKGLPFNKGGLSWAQWTGPRRREFEAWSAANHVDPRSDEAGYGFLKHELKGKYAGSVAALKHGASLETFERMFEGAGVKAYGSRHAYERRALQAYDRSPAVASGTPASARPIFVPPPRPHTPTPVHTNVHLDGEIIARAVTHHQVASNEFTHSHSMHDRHAHFSPPDTAFG